MEEKFINKNEILNELLAIITQHLCVKINFGKDYKRDRLLFRGLCNQSIELNGIGERFYLLQDQLLTLESKEKGIIDVCDFKFEKGIALWQGDITRLKADAIVNAANNQFLGCFQPCHNCIDNIIMSASGFQMRNELLKLKENKDYDSQKVKVTNAYNLPCNYVFHVAGPQIFGIVSKIDEKNLAECYENCLNKAKNLKLNNIVFCCISTGLYSFPNELACEIAVKTVKDWLNKNKFDLKIVFNVFKDIDKELYERKLRNSN